MHVYISNKNKLIKMGATLGVCWCTGLGNMTTNDAMHGKRKERIFWDEKAWGGALYYMATLYKATEQQNRIETLHNGEILTLTLLALACIACI